MLLDSCENFFAVGFSADPQYGAHESAGAAAACVRTAPDAGTAREGTSEEWLVCRRCRVLRPLTPDRPSETGTCGSLSTASPDTWPTG